MIAKLNCWRLFECPPIRIHHDNDAPEIEDRCLNSIYMVVSHTSFCHAYCIMSQYVDLSPPICLLKEKAPRTLLTFSRSRWVCNVALFGLSKRLLRIIHPWLGWLVAWNYLLYCDPFWIFYHNLNCYRATLWICYTVYGLYVHWTKLQGTLF